MKTNKPTPSPVSETPSPADASPATPKKGEENKLGRYSVSVSNTSSVSTQSTSRQSSLETSGYFYDPSHSIEDRSASPVHSDSSESSLSSDSKKRGVSSKRANRSSVLSTEVKSSLKTFKADFQAVRESVKQVWADRTGTRFVFHAPKWISEHCEEDPRYPVAFVRALQCLAPEKISQELRESAHVSLENIEKLLDLIHTPEKITISPPSEIGSSRIIDLVEAAATYNVLLNRSDTVLPLIMAAKLRFREDIVYQFQDVKGDLTRDLHLPKLK